MPGYFRENGLEFNGFLFRQSRLFISDIFSEQLKDNIKREGCVFFFQGFYLLVQFGVPAGGIFIPDRIANRIIGQLMAGDLFQGKPQVTA